MLGGLYAEVHFGSFMKAFGRGKWSSYRVGLNRDVVLIDGWS
jgi:hypothetical protein